MNVLKYAPMILIVAFLLGGFALLSGEFSIMGNTFGTASDDAFAFDDPNPAPVVVEEETAPTPEV